MEGLKLKLTTMEPLPITDIHHVMVEINAMRRAKQEVSHDYERKRKWQQDYEERKRGRHEGRKES